MTILLDNKKTLAPHARVFGKRLDAFVIFSNLNTKHPRKQFFVNLIVKLED